MKNFQTEHLKTALFYLPDPETDILHVLSDIQKGFSQGFLFFFKKK